MKFNAVMEVAQVKKSARFTRSYAAVDMSEMLKKRVLEAGFYVARIQDETFSLESPDKFQAKCF